MRITRYLKDEWIELELKTQPDQTIEEWTPKLRQRLKEEVISELVDLLARSGKIVNASRLKSEMTLREGKASTAIGQGVAIPHVRTLQAREMVIGFARSAVPIDFDAPDAKGVRLFFPMAAPSYDDQAYLQIYKRLAEVLSREEAIDQLLQVQSPGEVIRILSGELG